jgi:hypothetical protein
MHAFMPLSNSLVSSALTLRNITYHIVSISVKQEFIFCIPAALTTALIDAERGEKGEEAQGKISRENCLK